MHSSKTVKEVISEKRGKERGENKQKKVIKKWLPVEQHLQVHLYFALSPKGYNIILSKIRQEENEKH